MPRPTNILLMLDKDDITNVCGSITRNQVRKELNISRSQLNNFIDHERLFRDRYILIEDYEYGK